MARLALATAIVCLVGGPVWAQPVTWPGATPCTVSITEAPDEVRAEIEAWVNAEPRCRRELEIRVVLTADGLHLQARDRDGRVRERVVPDAQSAAVLVVSWMADDSLAAPPAPHEEPTPVEIAPPVIRIEPVTDGDIPSALTDGLSRGRTGHPPHWLTLGLLAGESLGVRGQVDLLTGHRWTLGVAGGWQETDHGAGTSQLRVTASTELSFGRMSLRAQLGLGGDVGSDTRRDLDQMDVVMERPTDRFGAAADAALLARVRVGDAWGLVGGPIVSASTRDDRATLSVFFGLQRGL